MTTLTGKGLPQHFMRVLLRDLNAWLELGWIEQCRQSIPSLPGERDVLVCWVGEGKPPMPKGGE